MLGLGLCAGPAMAVTIDTLALEMQPRDADVLFRKDPYDRSSFPVVVLDGPAATRRSGRIEVKGSFTRHAGKKSLLITLDAPNSRGERRLALNGMGTDGSLMREWLAWDLMRALRMVVPRATYTRLSINGRDSGLFLAIDWIDARLFERFGRGADGELYHPVDATHCADLTPSSLQPDRGCWLKLSPRDGDFTSLRQLVDAIAAAPSERFEQLVDQRFEPESLINWFAVNGLVGSTDTYNKNYFLFRSAARDRWLVVPWDYDLSFGRANDPYREFPGTILNEHFQYHYPIESGQSNPLHYRAMKNPVLRRRVVGRVRELIEGVPDGQHPWRGWFAPARLESRIDGLAAVLRAEIRRDPFLAGNEQRFEDEVAAVRAYARLRPRHLQRTLLNASDWVRDQAVIAVGGAGHRVDAMDGWGLLLASLSPRSPASGRVRVWVARGWPELVPPAVDRAACIQRSWLIDAAATFTAEVHLSYLDENLLLSEVGRSVPDERALRVYVRDRANWRSLETRAEPLANRLVAQDARIAAGPPTRLVACVPPGLVATAR